MASVYVKSNRPYGVLNGTNNSIVWQGRVATCLISPTANDYSLSLLCAHKSAAETRLVAPDVITNVDTPKPDIYPKDNKPYTVLLGTRKPLAEEFLTRVAVDYAATTMLGIALPPVAEIKLNRPTVVTNIDTQKANIYPKDNKPYAVLPGTVTPINRSYVVKSTETSEATGCIIDSPALQVAAEYVIPNLTTNTTLQAETCGAVGSANAPEILTVELVEATTATAQCSTPEPGVNTDYILSTETAIGTAVMPIPFLVYNQVVTLEPIEVICSLVSPSIASVTETSSDIFTSVVDAFAPVVITDCVVAVAPITAIAEYNAPSVNVALAIQSPTAEAFIDTQEPQVNCGLWTVVDSPTTLQAIIDIPNIQTSTILDSPTAEINGQAQLPTIDLLQLIRIVGPQVSLADVQQPALIINSVITVNTCTGIATFGDIALGDPVSIVVETLNSSTLMLPPALAMCIDILLSEAITILCTSPAPTIFATNMIAEVDSVGSVTLDILSPRISSPPIVKCMFTLKVSITNKYVLKAATRSGFTLKVGG